jgi:CHAT domain-containing protein
MVSIDCIYCNFEDSFVSLNLMKNNNISWRRIIKWFSLLVILLGYPQAIFSAEIPDAAFQDSIISLAEKHYRNSDYDSAYYYFDHALNSSEYFNYVNGIIKCRIGLANCSNAQGNYLNSLKQTSLGLELVEQRNSQNSVWLPPLFYLKGLAEYKLRNNEESLHSLNAGIKAYGNNLQHDSIFTLLNKTLGNNYLALGKLNEAKSAYELALSNELNRKDTNFLAASLIMNIGIIYSSRAEYIKGEEYFKKSLKIKERLSPESNKNLTNVYLNLGRLQSIIGKFDDALTNYNKAENNLLNEYGTDNENLIAIYLNKGGLFIMTNKLEKALAYHEKALELANKYYSAKNQIFSQIYGNLGIINKDLGNFSKAIEWSKKALLIDTNPEIIISTLRTVAYCYQELGETKKAQQNYELAIGTSNSENDNIRTISSSYLDYGIFNDKIGNFETAKVYLDKAIKIIRRDYGETSPIYANSLTILGNHFDLQGKYRIAQGYYQKSLIIYSKDFNDTNYYSNPDESQLIPDKNINQTLYNKAESLYSLYNAKSKDERDLLMSYQTSKLAINGFEKIRAGFTYEKSKLLITKNSKQLFDLALQTSLKLAEITKDTKYINKAFKISEKSKSAVLSSTIKESQALSFGGIPQNVLALESKLKNNIDIYTNLIYTENLKYVKNEENLSLWRNQLIVHNRDYDSLITLFELKYPKYFQLKYNNSSIDIPSLQSSLSDEEILIEYDFLDTVLVIFTVTNNSMKYTKINIDETFIKNVRSIIEITHKYPMVENANERLNLFVNSSFKLYSTLIEPVFTEIKDKKEVIIIPDDILGFVSFESLVKQLPPIGTKGYKKLDYLINDHCIRYSYSASLLLRDNRKPGKTNKVLAIAPTYSSDAILPSSIGQGLGLSLEPLDFAKEEVENILEYFPCEILIEDNATESKFKKLAKDFDILHFSMHTIINNEEPLSSKLVFSINSDSVDDGFLNTYEIYNLSLNAKLSVLSSCETGAGKLSKGEGILSLARGFIYSGIPSIVMTLWEIDDVSSADIISGFYERLKEGEKIDAALRNSKLNYIQTSDQLHAHPYFWSAYVQIGDNLPIVANSFSIKTVLFVSVTIIVIIILLLVKRKRN